MVEEYVGVRFAVVFESKEPPKDEKIEELIKWCRLYDELSLAPSYGQGSGGNLSFRTGAGFVITGTKTFLGTVRQEDLVLVEKIDWECDRPTIHVHGLKEPSSESMLHDALYKINPEVNCIMHGHDRIVMEHVEQLGVPVTKEERPYGSVALMEEVLSLMPTNYLVMKNHGIISMGKTIDEAGQLSLKYHEKALILDK